MSNLLKKVMTYVAVFLVAFLAIGAVAAVMPFPNPFLSTSARTSDLSVVYGTGAAQSDIDSSNSILTNLANRLTYTISDDNYLTNRIVSDGVTEDEMELGSSLPEGNIKRVLTDNKIPSLYDGKISWHDGDSSSSYNVHEEILIGNSGEIVLKTSLDNNDFEGVVLTNDKGLEYRYVFEEDIENIDNLEDDDVDPLELTILGKEYLINEVDGNSIIVTTAEESIIPEGGSVSYNGTTLTVNDIYEETVSVNGIFIKEGKIKTVDGVKIKVEYIYFRNSDVLPSKVKIYYGGEISQEYSDGDDYPGQDDDDPEWVWSINDPCEKSGWIGVKYDLRQIDEEDDVIEAGEQYMFPNNFAAVSFDGLTDVDYEEFEVSFDDVDLYAPLELDENEKVGNDIDVVIIEGPNEDSFELEGDIETDTLYLERTDSNRLIIYYRDVAEDYSNGKPMRHEIIGTGIVYSGDNCDCDNDTDADDFALNGTVCNVTSALNATNSTVYFGDDCDCDNDTDADDLALNGTVCDVTSEVIDIPDTVIATLVSDDTEFEISVINNGVTLSINGIEISLGGTTSYKYLGNDEDEAETKDVAVEGVNIGGYENDVMDHYGTIIKDPEGNAENDRVVLEIPSEQVNAQISVYGSEEDPVIVVPSDDNSTTTITFTPAELNMTTIADAQIATVAGKNVISVGGPCINTYTASLLGGKSCAEDFTAKTGVGVGKVLIQTFDRGNGKIATVVAGYDAADTVRGVQYVLGNSLELIAGQKVII